MKNLFIITLLLVSLYSCKPKPDKDSSHIISVSILPQKYLIDKITGGKFEVNVLIPSGASPASYEPSPLQIAQLTNSDLYFRIGEIIFEKTWIEKISLQNPGLKIVNLSENIEFIGAQAHKHSEDEMFESASDEHEHEHEKGLDPHIWMSPKNMRIISETILNQLSESYPEDSIAFSHNYEQLLSEINYVDSVYSASKDVLSGLNFLIYHPALGYLARDYNMTQHVLELEGKEPTPAHLSSIIDLALEKNIQFIFVQRQFSMDNAKSLAKEINAEIITIDPLAENWKEQLINIHEILISK
ncbi:MAG: zinc ABC transporter substrate-binding protein [Bacteroidales bacterium]|nr:zinc ABC transporter substrate-binding protein [Bacteroidales bacterium]MCF8389133.1 zinc ABC transporter substrate-binding protein [Bacteroidales bacterium]